MRAFLPRDLPGSLRGLAELALDLRWTWSHAVDGLWRMVSPEHWERTRNPWIILQDVPRARLVELAKDQRFREELRRLLTARKQYLVDAGWCGRACHAAEIEGIAYFGMEFGLGEALPLYAGGLGVLAGDYLKTASDLGVPAIGVGLLYQAGYFRQTLDAGGEQQEAYPYNDPTSLPIQPVLAPEGGWLHVTVNLPGRPLLLRVWQARVGRVPLYLPDSNDPLNSPADRGITGELYGGGAEQRLKQEIVLGIGGWRLLEAIGPRVDLCHLNEGHAAFVVLERARSFMAQHGASFAEALWATRAGTIFTTHTPVAAGFDAFPPELIARYFPPVGDYLGELGLSLQELLALGRRDPGAAGEPFNMAHLAFRGSAWANGVSRLHGAVSRAIFRDLFPRWPEREVPVTHVTNGVHVPSWDSSWADALWTEASGKARWLGAVKGHPAAIHALGDAALWEFRAAARHDLVRYARTRLTRQLAERGAPPEAVADAGKVLDANVLTLGFARRFAAYKRPTLLLADPARLVRLLTSHECPVQLVVAGKAHPRDEEGKRLIRAWAEFVRQPAALSRAVFLEDYDLSLAQELVQGVDVWLNTPRRPWEASGTSGMKVLANGGLNLSELDGWWAEAYAADIGWALGDGREHAEPDWDAREAEQLYHLLETEVVPAFYTRDAQGIPRGWVARIRGSMARLAPEFSGNRMVREYVDTLYRPAAAAFRRRSAAGGREARELQAWRAMLERCWDEVRFGAVRVVREAAAWRFDVDVHLGQLAAEAVSVELYAEPEGDGEPRREVMARGDALPGPTPGYVYHARVSSSRPAEDFTPRVIPCHPGVRTPMEAPLIRWAP